MQLLSPFSLVNLTLAWTLFCCCGCCRRTGPSSGDKGRGSLPPVVIEMKDFVWPSDSIPGEQRYERVIEIGHGVSTRAVIEVTSKGNGILKIGDLRLRVYDDHDDGAYYLGSLLHIEFADVNGDDYRDMVISGIVSHGGEKEWEERKMESLVFIYRYDVERSTFVLVYRKGQTDIC